MIKLLVVEDDKVLSNNIKEILAAIGEITQVYDGSEGLFELESGVYDLAILDLMMPEMNGYEVLAKIRKRKNTDSSIDFDCKKIVWKIRLKDLNEVQMII